MFMHNYMIYELLGKFKICAIMEKDGSVSEWFKEHAWKACERVTVPEVRILSLPPESE